MTSRDNILGVRISPVNISQAVETIDSWITRGDRQYVCVTAIHVVMDGFWNPDIRRIINQAGMVTPDGMGIVWLLKLQGHRSVSRVYSPDLMDQLFQRGLSKGWRHFFYGGKPGVPDLLAARLVERFPGMRVAGMISPPFRELTPAEDEAMVGRIQDARADILWLGMTSDRQIRWMGNHFGRLKVPVMIGVGAAFDFMSGQVKQAPRWMRQSGLEWIFRLATEPGRLWRRYAQYPLFALLTAAQLLGLKRYD